MDTIEQEIKFKIWKKRVESNDCTIHSAEPINEIRKKDGSLLFALLKTEVISPENKKLPHILFLRGDACVIVILLRNKSTGEEKFLMVRQRRIGNGQMCLEFPAGMLDESSNAPEVAVREIFEETGLPLKEDELFALTDTVLYSSAGASDEGIHYFGALKEVDDQTFNSFFDKEGGCCDENEHISTTLMSRTDAEQETTSLQARLGFFLFEQHINRAKEQQ